MKLKSLFDKAKKTVDERGGVQSLKEDAQERGTAKTLLSKREQRLICTPLGG
jgi:hypothetical protein